MISTARRQRSSTVVKLKWPILASSVLIMVVSFVAMPVAPGTLEEAVAAEIGYMLRVTARLAFAYLMLAYVARPLVRLFGVGRPLVRNRRYLGLSMAITHTVHFGYVVSLVTVLGQEIEWITLIFGGLAFVLMWLMAATSNDASVRALGRWWGRLHTIGVHYLWLIFMQSFVPRAFAADASAFDSYLYGALCLLGLVGLLLRISAFVVARRHASPGAAARTT